MAVMVKTSYFLNLVVAGLILSTLAITLGPVAPTTTAAAQAARKEVPFGDKVGPAVTNYNRLRPHIATAGALKDGAISELKSLGFATILNLCGPDEGADVEKRAVEAAGLRFFNIPFTEMIPSDEQVAEFARIVEDAGYFPLLIHCGSASRAGAMWTLYRAHRGIPIAIAVEEGRTTGMRPDREDAVLKHLGRSTIDK
jgi:uncharacterized protein (TIGR01244 family)